MPAPKGTMPPAAGRGRRRGSKNKLGREVREMIEQGLEKVGPYLPAVLINLAKDDPAAFVDAYARLAQFILPYLQATKMEVSTPPRLPDNPFGISFQDGGPGMPRPEVEQTDAGNDILDDEPVAVIQAGKPNPAELPKGLAQRSLFEILGGD